MKLYKQIASTIVARENCRKSGNDEWFARHTECLEACEKQLPSGSGFDAGTSIDLEKSTSDKFVLKTAFHHMDEYGGYDGWTEHTVTVKPNLLHDFELVIGGRNRNDIKDYIHETFDHVLTEEAVEEKAA